jgi:cytochrome d ubiquinol oxidase subunit II
MEIYQIIWFVLWSVLWAVYFMLDGFDFGAGMLKNFIAKNENEHQAVMSSIGPVWDGNEVWLITAGGATFAAFPTTYALMFSYLYSALLLILFALIVRGVAMELRNKEKGAKWRKNWDIALLGSSFLPALLFGVAFGNIFQGLPMDETGYHGTLFTLLNPYGLITGVLFVLLFIMHGALWISFKTDGDLSYRASGFAAKLWIPLVLVAVTFLIATHFATHLYDNFLKAPVFLILPLLAVAALLSIRLFIARGQSLMAFYASCATILMVVFTGVTGLFPNLIPSSIDAKHSLTIYNSSSSLYTLKIMTVVALIFVPIVIAYQIWNYRVFRQKINSAESSSEGY